ncbi:MULTISPECIES: hypothetical protein [unclassified Microcella]|uniref:hypothetical protein n=1 Tax=unclassified Microcella TaxID=2630066 RepID=UPI0006FB104F|nr:MULTISPECIES: hypothetical protein [unclassified Microcella]KQV25200.1 hypothetical protein ASC54_12190 [Yonghaparkia sp. Root332]KRF31482.1 hypothetical protein ASG83_11995 [Yonghaparkia sp. Soil809]
MTNVYLRWLGAIAIVLPSIAAFLWVVGIARDAQEFGAGALDFAIAGSLLQWGVLSLLLWLVGRGITAHLPPLTTGAGAEDIPDVASAPEPA